MSERERERGAERAGDRELLGAAPARLATALERAFGVPSTERAAGVRSSVDALQANISAMLDGRAEDVEIAPELCTPEARAIRRRTDAQLIAAARADNSPPRASPGR